MCKPKTVDEAIQEQLNLANRFKNDPELSAHFREVAFSLCDRSEYEQLNAWAWDGAE